MRDMVDTDPDPVLLPPLLGVVVQPGIVGWNEMAPGEDAQAGPLLLGGRLAGLEHRQEGASGSACPGDPQEAAATDGGGRGLERVQITHRAPPSGIGMGTESVNSFMRLAARLSRPISC